jgi:glycosyltransferase involved in cell wall biosynthesis
MSTRPSVLHLIDTGGPGGAETVFAALASRLTAGRTTPVAVVPREDWLSRHLRANGIEPLLHESRGSLNLRYFRDLRALCQQRQVGLIHTHLLGSAVYGAMLGATLGVPVISVFHGPVDFRYAGRFVALKRALVTRVPMALVAVSNSTREAMIGFGIPARRIEVIGNGIDVSQYPPGRATALRAELGVSDDALLVGAVGNIRYAKAYDVLLDAAHALRRTHPHIHFVIVGEGTEADRATLLEQRHRLGLEDRVHLAGFRPSNAELFQSFDIFVSSARSEGLPLSFLEAMASGLPMVATASGQEVVEHEITGLVPPAQNADALAAALARVADDTSLRTRLAAAGRKKVLDLYNLDHTVGRYEALYRRALPRAGL